jgi:hypothetical protein
MNLPREPGLYRRLAYGEYIRTRNRSRYYNNSYNSYEQLVELEDVKIGLSNTELSCIFKTNTCTNQFFCSICQEQKDTNPELFNIKTLICNHTFHNKCIKKWLSKNKTCPLCRLDLSSN